MPIFVVDLKFKTMKKLFITAVTAIMFSVTAFAAEGTKTFITGEENVSYTALNSFKAEYRDAKEPAWTVTSNTQKVTFKLDGVQMTAFYSLGGDYMGTTQDVAYKVIPADAQKTIATKYTGYAVSEVIKYENIDTDAVPTVYFVDLKKGTSEILLKVSAGEGVSFFKTVK